MKEQIEAVQRMQDYIENHLYEKITFADLAKASYYSPWYSYRLFTMWLKTTPTEYIRRIRLSRSAIRLRSENVRIIDVAFDAGFNSVDGYQRAFLREFGFNPSEYAKNEVPVSLFKPYGIKSCEMRKEITMENVKNVFIQVIRKPERSVLIKRGKTASEYFAYCEEVGCDIWETLETMDSISPEPVCLWLPEKYIAPGTSQYVQGVEVDADYKGEIPDGFDIIKLPEAEYLMFNGEPFAEEDYQEAIGYLWDAMKKYNPSVIGYEWDDENPRIQLIPIGTRGYIELRAIRKQS